MHSLPASPGADSLAADSSRPGPSIPQDTFLAFGLRAHPSPLSALTPHPQVLPTPRSCCRACTLASLPPPPPLAALEGLEQPAELCLAGSRSLGVAGPICPVLQPHGREC